MPQTGLRPHDQRMPPAINIIALATFAASLSARALDPVLPHVADEFGVSIATAASFSSVFAFTFAIVQPALGAAADLFGKARLMIVCLVLLGLANILGALSTSFPLLFATRILAGVGSGGVFPVALGLTSDLVGPEKRQVAIGRTLAGSKRNSTSCSPAGTGTTLNSTSPRRIDQRAAQLPATNPCLWRPGQCRPESEPRLEVQEAWSTP